MISPSKRMIKAESTINRKKDTNGIALQSRWQKLGHFERVRHTEIRHDVESPAADEGLGTLSG